MKRKFMALLVWSCAWASLIFSLSILAFILWEILYQGASAISFSFLTQASENFGRHGGVLYQILGTLLLIFSAALLSIPIALGTAHFETSYLFPGLRKITDVFIYALNGVPTILFGLFGYLIFGVYFQMGVSWLTGAFILSMMILPTLIVGIKEGIDAIPGKYAAAAAALGLTRWQMIRSVLFPQSLLGLLTGLLLGLARAAGETAAIMFTATAFSGAGLPHSFHEPVATLQTHILTLSQEALYPMTRTNAWGTALILVAMIFVMNLMVMAIRGKMTAEAGR